MISEQGTEYEIEPFEPLWVREGEGSGEEAGEGAGSGEGADSGEGPGASEGGRKTALGGEGEGEGEGASQGASQGAPEAYEEFTLPENVKFEGEELEQFQAFAKELNLTQEQAQQLLDRDLAARQAIEARVTSEADAAIEQWAKDAQADEEFGGDKYNENLAVARKALETFGTQQLKDMLNQSGLGNHPEAIRFMYRVGKAISEDKLVTGSRRQEAPRFYTNSNHVA